MLQVLRKGLKEIVVEEVPESSLRAGEVKIRTAYSLISSGTELAGLHVDGVLNKMVGERHRIGRMVERAVRSQGVRSTAEAVLDKFSELTITGYSGAGIVIDRSGSADLEIGRRVAYGGASAGHAEIICVPRNLAAPVPDGVSLKQAALSTVGSIALHAVRNACISIGDSVGVIGLGLIGQLVIQIARAAGARVFGIDINRDRMEQAARYGLEGVFHAADDPSAILSRTGGIGFDSVIVCASSRSAAPVEQAVRTTRSRGRIVVVGMVAMTVSWEEAYKKEIRIMVSRAYGPGSYDPLYEKDGIDYPIDYVRWTENRNMVEFMRLIESSLVGTDRILTHEFKVQDAPEAYRMLAEGETKIVGAVLSYGEPDEQPKAAGTKIEIATPKAAARPKTDRMRVGLIGLGNIATWVHLPNVGKHPNLELRGVCTPKGYRAKHLGRRFKSRYCTTDYREIISDPGIDIVFICTRNNTHARIALEALNAGKHVFIEKPAAMTREDCLRLCKAVEKTGLGFAVNYNRRFSPMYGIVREHFKNVHPKVISMRMNSPDMRGNYWMMDPEEGGGAILGEACHFFDLIRWYAGSDPSTVYADGLKDGADGQVRGNNLVCSITFENGSIAGLLYETVGSRDLGSERLEISAAGKSAVVEDIRAMRIYDGMAGIKRSKFRPEKGYYEILDDFVRGIRAGRSFMEEALNGAKATLCALTALKSAESHVPEPVERL